jgi:beta-N-acetylhexosaminidase
MTETADLFGSLLICGFDGVSLPQQIAENLRRQRLAGVILFARNYQNREQLQTLTGAIRTARPDALIAVDQEGGRVVRFTEDFPVYPSPAYFAKGEDLAGLYHATAATARNLRQCGINLNLTPVCDLQPDAKDHVIAGRAASPQPTLMGEIASRQIETQHKEKILTCAKHFPGLASTSGDPHAVISRSKQSLDNFRKFDYEPFRAAIGAGVDMIMVSHLLAPAFDPEQLATFSSVVVQGELRDQLSFNGPIVTDDLLMGAVTQTHSPVEAAVGALAAGCDLLLFGKLVEQLDDLIDTAAERINADQILQENLRKSVERIEQLRKKWSWLT